MVAFSLITVACQASSSPQKSLYGPWQVSGSRCPHTCEMSQAEAAEWHGRSARYSEARAQFADYVCEQPNYRVDYWPAAGIYGGVRLSDLGITAGSVMVVDVLCAPPGSGSDRWRQGPGAFLVVTNPDHLFMVWKGRYFDLRRE